MEPTEINLAITTTAVTGPNTGSASAMATGGTTPYTYLWSNGETTASIENLDGGEYHLTLTAANGCTIESSAIVDVQLAANEADALGLKLFPNPVKDHLFLELDAAFSLKEVSVFDVLGGSVSAEYEISGDRVEVLFDKGIEAGVYFLQVTLSDGKKGLRRFVVE